MSYTLDRLAFLSLVDWYIKTEHNSKIGAVIFIRKESAYYNNSGQKIFEISSYKEKDTSFRLHIRPESIKVILDIFDLISSEYQIKYNVLILENTELKADFTI